MDGVFDRVNELQSMRETATQRRKDRLAKARQKLQKKEPKDAEEAKSMHAQDEVPGPVSAASASVPCAVSDTAANAESMSPPAARGMPVLYGHLQ